MSWEAEKKEKKQEKNTSTKKKKMKKQKNSTKNVADRITKKTVTMKKKHNNRNKCKQDKPEDIIPKKEEPDVAKNQKIKTWEGHLNNMNKGSSSNRRLTLVNKAKILKSHSRLQTRRSRYRPISTNNPVHANSPTYKRQIHLSNQAVRGGVQAMEKSSKFLSHPSRKKINKKKKKKETYQLFLAKFKNARLQLSSHQRKTNIYHSHRDVCAISSCRFAIVPGSVNTKSGMIVTISVTMCNHATVSPSSRPQKSPKLPFPLTLNSINENGQSNGRNQSKYDTECICPCPSCSLKDLYISTHGSPSLQKSQRNFGQTAIDNNSESNIWPFIRPISVLPEPQPVQHIPYTSWEVGTEAMNWFPQPQSQSPLWPQWTASQPCKYGPYCNREDCCFAHPESNPSLWWCSNRTDVVYFPNLGVVRPDAVVYQ